MTFTFHKVVWRRT